MLTQISLIWIYTVEEASKNISADDNCRHLLSLALLGLKIHNGTSKLCVYQTRYTNSSAKESIKLHNQDKQIQRIYVPLLLNVCKFQKKIVGVAHTRYPLSIHFECNNARKMTKFNL